MLQSLQKTCKTKFYLTNRSRRSLARTNFPNFTSELGTPMLPIYLLKIDINSGNSNALLFG